MPTASDIMVNFGTAAIYRELKHVQIRIVNSLSITVNIRAGNNINHIIMTF